jgi:hypothetical protein
MKLNCSTQTFEPHDPEPLCPARSSHGSGFSARASAFVATLVLFLGNAWGQNAAWNTGANAEPDGRGRTFNLIITNSTNERIVCSVSNTSCCDSPVNGADSGWIGAGNTRSLWIARVQGNGCDGKNGSFRLQVRAEGSNLLDGQSFTFDNEGHISMASSLNRFNGILSSRDATTGAYVYRILPVNSRLPAPVDERLTKPRNYVAYDSGEWARLDSQTTAKIEHLEFSQNNFWPVWYEICGWEAPVGDIPFFHPQHMKRLPNKDGRAYFMIAGSRGHNGYLSWVKVRFIRLNYAAIEGVLSGLGLG